MKSYGLEMLVMDIDWSRTGNETVVYGTDKGVAFVEAIPDLEWNFASYTSGTYF